MGSAKSLLYDLNTPRMPGLAKLTIAVGQENNLLMTMVRLFITSCRHFAAMSSTFQVPQPHEA